MLGPLACGRPTLELSTPRGLYPMEKKHMPEHFVKICDLWEGPMLEKFIKDCIPWQGPGAGVKEQREEEGVAETK